VGYDPQSASTPSYKFDVKGVARFTGALTADAGVSLSGTASNITLGSNYLSGDGDDEGIYVDGDGSVGVGTDSPSFALDVNGTARITGDVDLTSANIYYGVTSGTPSKLNINVHTNTGTYSGINIGNLNTATTTNSTVVGGRNTISDAGHIIYGHGNTISQLSSVFGDTNTVTADAGPGHIIMGKGNYSDSYSANKNTSLIYGSRNDTNTYYGNGLFGTGLKYYANRQLAFGTNASNVNFALSEVFFGNGVRNENTTANSNSGNGPDVSINVSQANNSADKNGGNLTLKGGQGTGSGTSGDVIIATHSTTTSGSTYQTSSDRFIVKGTTGNVGIGTTSPNEALEVTGTIRASNLTGGATNLTTDANGNIIRDPSDIKLKKNINTLEGSLDRVLALRGVSYDWKDTDRFGTQTEIGFIAQEVELIVPEVVRDGGEYMSINTRNLIAIAVGGIQELYEIVIGFGERFETDELCVEGVCINGEQLSKILEESGYSDSKTSNNDKEEQDDSEGSSSDQDEKQPKNQEPDSAEDSEVAGEEEEDENSSENIDDGNEESEGVVSQAEGEGSALGSTEEVEGKEQVGDEEEIKNTASEESAPTKPEEKKEESTPETEEENNEESENEGGTELTP